MSVILLYHRVTDLTTDPQLLAVTPGHFAEHLAVLRRVATPAKLAHLAAGSAPADNAVAVTFDDGYADNLHEAAPLLRRFDVPATVFVATGNLGTGREFFWDELDRIFLQPCALPSELMVAGRRFDLGADAIYPTEAWMRHRPWDVTQADAPTSRQRVYRELCGLVHAMPTDARDSTLREIRTWARVDPAGRPSHRVVTRNEVRTLAADGLVEVAAHTVKHPLLSAETVNSQRVEIHASKTTLEEILGREVGGFSYPFGTRHSYDAGTVDLVKRTGFAYACSNFTGRVGASTDRHQLPRFIVRDWDGDTFDRHLRQWLARPNVQ